jgi:hypothetical protein
MSFLAYNSLSLLSLSYLYLLSDGFVCAEDMG